MSSGDYRWEIHTNTNRIWNLYIAMHGGQWSKLDSIVFSLLTKAEEMETSHPSASFLPSLCGPASPCPTPPLTRDPVSSPRRLSSFTLGPHTNSRGCYIPAAHGPLSSSLFFHYFHTAWCHGAGTSHWHNIAPKQGHDFYWSYSRFALVHLRSKFDIGKPPSELCIEVLRIAP